jgi:pimeloyl-ACP methyl ester carboxylesterase
MPPQVTISCGLWQDRANLEFALKPILKDRFVDTADGLRLHVLEAGPKLSSRLPVVCLPGLARTNEDFRELMQALCEGEIPRRVVALSSRGRGLSSRDPNPANYAVPVELKDLIAALDQLAIPRAGFVGTSRGGILTMALTAAQPDRIAGAVLNDIGPVLELKGLLRIQSYVGKLPRPSSWDEAIAVMKSVMGREFPAFNREEWLRYAKLTFMETRDGFSGRTDPAIAHNLRDIAPDTPPPPMWPLYEGLTNVPVLVLRGEHSDLLSRETVAEMQKRHPACEAIEVPGMGHPPTLDDASMIEPIRRWIERCDARA